MVANIPYGMGNTGARLGIQLTSNAVQANFRSTAQGAAGNTFVKAELTVPKEEGKAKPLLLKLLACKPILPTSFMRIASCTQGRQKSI